MVIQDFCEKFGGQENAMPIVKQQFRKAGADIGAPTPDGLLRVIDALAEVEKDFKDPQTIARNRSARRLWVEAAAGVISA